ncbi:MAG: RluA family pseudouridine synthase [bacterium]|nr:RluA family pseudouridine synthase [bacterium]
MNGLIGGKKTSVRFLYLAAMVTLKTHTVGILKESIRFVDYLIGVFEGFETRNAVKTGIKKRRFLINGELAETGTWLKEGDRIELLERREKPKAYDKKIEIVFEDDYLAIVNKPAGLVVSGNQFKTLENCLVDQLQPSKASDALDWGLPVHRLDAPTSGLVLFAKTVSIRRAMGEMLEDKRIEKRYHAVVHGIPKEGEIEVPVDGKQAKSQLKLIETVDSIQNEHLSLVELEPITGRTHQLRIHCQSIGNPIVGDQLYGNPNGTFRNKGLFLSSTQLKFLHPITQAFVDVQTPIPNKFTSLLKREAKRAERYM